MPTIQNIINAEAFTHSPTNWKEGLCIKFGGVESEHRGFQRWKGVKERYTFFHSKGGKGEKLVNIYVTMIYLGKLKFEIINCLIKQMRDALLR